MNTDDLIAGQIDYYRARAAEYDDWFERREEYHISDAFVSRWEDDVANVRQWLASNPPTGDVLEIAAGTGNWTGQLLESAQTVTIVDAAPEMLEQLKAKHPHTRRVVADIFAWTPPRRYDNIFFAFWLSHVPTARWEAFWATVENALEPGGQVWFVDNAHPDFATAEGPGDWPEAAGVRQAERAGIDEHGRTLRDGSHWTVVKRYWRPEELAAQLEELGWLAQIDLTSFAFMYGRAHRT